jgi:hypothetical protein
MPSKRGTSHLSVTVHGRHMVINVRCFSHELAHAVAQLVEALRYKPEGRGFDPRWCRGNFSLT